jgi:hypothetical protein
MRLAPKPVEVFNLEDDIYVSFETHGHLVKIVVKNISCNCVDSFILEKPFVDKVGRYNIAKHANEAVGNKSFHEPYTGRIIDERLPEFFLLKMRTEKLNALD